jgi:cell division protein FtsI (penicillin-binding protein 3)
MSLKSRACLACYGLGAVFTLLSGRVIYLAVTRHDYYAQKAADNYHAKQSIPASRGSIQDAEGNFLARNEPYRNVILDGSLMMHPKAPGKVADLLAGPLQMSRDEILGKIHPQRKYVVLKKKVSEELALTLEKAAQKAGLGGITFEHGYERVYPAGQMLCHVVGFCGMNGNDPKGSSFRGVEGIERSMDSLLQGQDGWRHYEKDARGHELVNYPSEERSARHGRNVRLTVNLNLQQIVESELESACKRLRPLRATVIMMKPDTGDILALANRPAFDPNEAGKAKPETRINNAVAGSFEPGSTFKMVTCAGAINSRLVKPDTQLWCENGTWRYGGKPLRDHHPYGMLSVSQVIEKSSNIGAAKLAVQLGEERFYSYIRAFGFGQNTGIGMTGEVTGTVRPREKWTGLSITRIAMGHEVTATPLQVVTATCAIANGGRLLMPKLVQDIRDESDNVVTAYEPQVIRQVVTGPTAVQVRDALIKVTGKKGTASRAHIPGFNVAGKTGTAQKVEDGHYSHDHHVTSFVGFVPAEKPAFCMIVLFDQAKVPSNEDVGGLVAAPVFRSIAERALAHLGIEPDPALLQQETGENLKLAKADRN